MFYFKKAFDSVPHSQLLSKLEEIGLNQCILSWITTISYLVSSNVSPVTFGVPQGSVLRPLLFLIYIDDISKNLTISWEYSSLVLYADDILLYHPISSTYDNHALQSDIDTLYRWSILKAITFNTSKCKSMLISRKKSLTSTNTSLT